MDIRKKRNELRLEGMALQSAYLGETNKNKYVRYEQGIKLKQRQNEVYKKWKFYDEFIKASRK